MTDIKPHTISTSPRKGSIAAQWGNKPGLFDPGFLVVPHKFLREYANLRPFALTTGEALFVLHLMSFKWNEAAPFPTYKRIANYMGVSEKMVRRYAQALQRKGYLRRQFRTQAANAFDLTDLFNALAH
jgi:hypothetical protein